MRIENELKLGFKDVMIRPKRSTLKSRSQVTLEREFTFLHSDIVWKGIPIMAANMDTVGTFEMAKTLGRQNIFTAPPLITDDSIIVDTMQRMDRVFEKMDLNFIF